MGDLENRDKTYKVVQASVLVALLKRSMRASSQYVCAVQKAALLELFFCRAVHAIGGVEIGW
jgi:hypothetical protein